MPIPPDSQVWLCAQCSRTPHHPKWNNEEHFCPDKAFLVWDPPKLNGNVVEYFSAERYHRDGTERKQDQPSTAIIPTISTNFFGGKWFLPTTMTLMVLAIIIYMVITRFL